MEAEKKIKIYRDTYEMLESKEGVENLGRPEEQKDLILQCTVGGAKVTYTLRSDVDLVMLGAEIHCPGKSHEEIMEFGERLTNGVVGVSTT